MLPGIDKTHDPSRRSWVESANEPGTDFPIQNLPLGVFSPPEQSARHIGTAIGDRILDITGAEAAGLIPEAEHATLATETLDALFAGGLPVLKQLRHRLSELLSSDATDALREQLQQLLYPACDCVMHRPTRLGSYTDFYAGIHHARAAGSLLTPEDPLPKNYKWVPIAYHSRASSVAVSGTSVPRPLGQTRPLTNAEAPNFGPCRNLDLELEMGFFVGPGNKRGEPIPIGQAKDQIMGFCLLNDWSGRDIQSWEMFPLGPFLSKSFTTTISPWVITLHALAPFRIPAMERADADPEPLDYLDDEKDQESGGLEVALEVWLSTAQMRSEGAESERIITSNSRYLYWTPAQMMAHHTSNGCDLQTGDLLGTGTISGPSQSELSSLLELTVGGSQPITLSNGERRTFLEDGDEITFRGRCARDGVVPIGFGECSGRVDPAPETLK